MNERRTREVRVGDVIIGGGHPVSIQSMTNTRTEDVASTVAQIRALTDAGCEIVRCAVPNEEAARALSEIRKQITIPLVADIHFDYRLALTAIEGGVDKVRINPGNIGSRDRVRAVAEAAKERQIPIRIGVNGGSLDKDLLEQYGPTAEALVESALRQADALEQEGFSDIVISIKSSQVPTCVEAYEQIAKKADYPLHIGITEAGVGSDGIIKSAAGLGILLHEGIGDTMRVSLTDDPVEEVRAAKSILNAVGLRREGVEVVSCPTCGRTEIDLVTLAGQVRELVKDMPLTLRVAVMGCVVNGPGEAREADIGIAGGKGEGILIRKGEIIRKVPEEQLLDTLREELQRWMK